MDYKKLLIKYIEHIANNEGTCFIGDGYTDDELFSEQEWSELNIIADAMSRWGTDDAEFEVVEPNQLPNTSPQPSEAKQ